METNIEELTLEDIQEQIILAAQNLPKLYSRPAPRNKNEARRHLEALIELYYATGSKHDTSW